MFRNWICTINNPDDFDLLRFFDPTRMNYLGGQLEKGENGTPHLQFFINYKRTVRFSTVKKLHPKIHAEHAKYPQKALQYCLKEETRIDGPWTYGDYELDESKVKLTRQVLDEMTIEEIKEQLTPMQIIQYASSIKALNDIHVFKDKEGVIKSVMNHYNTQ